MMRTLGAISNCPFSQNTVSDSPMTFSSMAAAAAMTLMVEPGSMVSWAAMFFIGFGGQEAKAKISPVPGSCTATMPWFRECLATASERNSSA